MSVVNTPQRHPRYGTVGNHVDVDTNAFELSWPADSIVIHYDVTLKANFRGRGGKEIALGGEKGRELVQRLQTKIRPDLFPVPGGYDGKKNLYAFRAFKFTSQRFTVPWEKAVNDDKDVDVTIVRVREVDISLLRRILAGHEQGKPESIGTGTDVASSINMLQVFLQATPREAEGNLVKGKSVYAYRRRGNLNQNQRKFDEKMSPLRLIDGLFQSVRLSIDRLIVNIDFTVGVLLPGMSLEELCAKFLHCQNVRDIQRYTSRVEFDRLKHFLRDVKVTVNIPGKSSKAKARRIRGLILDVGSHTFDRNGVPTTVEKYFLETHNTRISPKTIGVSIGHHEIFPISVCTVPEQLYKSRLEPDKVREVLSYVPQNPQQRLQRIQAGWQNLEYSTSHFLRGANITVNDRPLAIRGRLLDEVSIRYGPDSGRSRPNNFSKKRGTWDVMGRRLFQPVKLSCVMILNFTGRPTFQGSELETLGFHLFKNMEARGISMGKKTAIIDCQTFTDDLKLRDFIWGKIKEEKAPPDTLLVAILPENAAELYANIKRVGDVMLGIPTQCVRWSSKLIKNTRDNRVDQYLNNLILKINTRCGGINHVPDSDVMEFLRKVPTMVIGADVSHPSPGSRAPSFASLVSSRDPYCSLYSGQIKMQPSRQEVIDPNSLSDMMKNAIDLFNKINAPHPLQRIFFFRDGVSEGEFETIRKHELDVLKKLLWDLYKDKMPSITFMVVGKRHHFRFFPRSSRDADSSGNCPSGFVVDQGIEHPVYSDFYLQSQAGLKGTSIPAHYTVIEDKNCGGSGDWLQAIAYTLCHTYQRSTCSVKIPAPVYYADLVCQRARFHFPSKFSNQIEDLSDAASDDVPMNLAQDFHERHDRLEKNHALHV
ncbi:Piwi domain-containing protein, partial [Rhodocollybia butyracea]